MRKIVAKHGYEVWAKWDNTAEIYELFNDREGSAYIGCADTIEEAIPVGLWFIDEQLAESSWNAS